MANPTLQTYITACRRLLFDANGTFWSDQELTDYINEARLKTVAATCCYRSIASVTLNVESCTGTGNTTEILAVSPTPDWSWVGGALVGTGLTGIASTSPIVQTVDGTTLGIAGTATAGALSFTYYRESYPFSSVTTASNEPILAVLGISAIWGNTRYTLQRRPWTQYNALMRSYVQFQQRPAVWALQGQNTVWIGPVVDQQYITEWDCVVEPPVLVNPGDVDVIAYPFYEAVKYHACYLAQLQQQAYDKASQMEMEFRRTAASAIAGNMQRVIRNVYQDLS